MSSFFGMLCNPSLIYTLGCLTCPVSDDYDIVCARLVVRKNLMAAVTVMYILV